MSLLSSDKPVLSSLLDAFKPFRGLKEFNYKSVQVDFILICCSHPINMYLCTSSLMLKCSILQYVLQWTFQYVLDLNHINFPFNSSEINIQNPSVKAQVSRWPKTKRLQQKWDCNPHEPSMPLLWDLLEGSFLWHPVDLIYNFLFSWSSLPLRRCLGLVLWNGWEEKV